MNYGLRGNTKTTVISDRIRIERMLEGRMGQNLVHVFDGYVDDVLVVFDRRKWLVKAVCEAVAAGHVSSKGDAMMGWDKWACTNAPELYQRACDTDR